MAALARWPSTGPRLASSWLLLVVLCLLFGHSSAYQVALHDDDPLRQTCSGMWAGKNTSITVTFDQGSAGTISTLIYEYADFPKIGKPSGERDVFGDPIMAYVCTAALVNAKICTDADLGTFILNIDEAKLNTTTIRREKVELGNEDIKEPKQLTYPVTRQGYYCVGAMAVPMTTTNAALSFHTHFTGRVNFKNIFNGELPASEYPKLQFYFSLGCFYLLVASFWGYLCFKHRDELLTVQHFVSLTLVLLVLGCAAQWGYLRYLNAYPFDFWTISSLDKSGSLTAGARTLLIISSILDAARNSISFFLLLIVAMGYGVVRPSIGPVMKRVRILAACHFICGVLYSVGVVLIITESAGSFIFAAILPLAFTLTAFMSWTLHSLNATIDHLTARKQTFKREMFVKLYRILLAAVIFIFGFFILSSIFFSQSGGDSFSPRTWPYRWFLLDGWMGGLYCAVFCAIAFIWRPTGRNMMLSMSDELAQDEDLDADAYEVDEFAHHTGRASDEEEGGVKHTDEDGIQPRANGAAGSTGRASGSAAANSGRRDLDDEDVVFEIGDDDDDAGGAGGRGSGRSVVGAGRSSRDGAEGERQGLMSLDGASRETLVPGGKRD